MVLYETKNLYGGAIQSNIPTGVIDASELRQIPDTQEVFVSASENTSDYRELNKEDSLIIDLMERVDSDDKSAITTHFVEITNLNGAGNEWKLLDVTKAKNKVNSNSYIAIGIEPALKWGRDESNGKTLKPTLVVVLGIIRLEKVDTDLLITYNVHISDEKTLEDLQKLHDVGEWSHVQHDNNAYKRISLAQSVVEEVLSTLEVKDWHLFG